MQLEAQSDLDGVWKCRRDLFQDFFFCSVFWRKSKKRSWEIIQNKMHSSGTFLGSYLCSQSLKNSSNSNITAPLSNPFQPLVTLTVNKAFPNALYSLLISHYNSGCFHGIVEFYIYDALKLYVWFLKASRQLVLFHIYHCWWFSSKTVFICQKYFTNICSQWNNLLCIFLKQLIDTSTLNRGEAVCSHIDKINNVKIILERFTLSVT